MQLLDPLRSQLQSGSSITFTVRIRPKAKENRVRGVLDDGTYKIDITAVPEDGKANAELVRFLAEEFDVSMHQIEILLGQTGSRKTITIHR